MTRSVIPHPTVGSRFLLRLLLVALGLALAAGTLAARASANEVTSFSVTPSSSLAGAHGDLTIDVQGATDDYPAADTLSGSSDDPYTAQNLKQVTVQLPPGLLGNPTAVPSCANDLLQTNAAQCPPASEVGTMSIDLGNPYGGNEPIGDNGSGYSGGLYNVLIEPIVNLPPLPGEVARFGVPVDDSAAVVYIDVTLRDGSDYGVTATVGNIPTALAAFGAQITLWGAPGASVHNTQRLACWNVPPAGDDFLAGCSAALSSDTSFLVNPTSCAGPTTATVSVTTYQDPDTPSNLSAMIPAFTGCSSLPFTPSLSVSSGTGQVGEPDAFAVGLTNPQADPTDLSPDTTPNVNNVSVSLPPGVALSPGAVNGLGSCSDLQLGQGSDAPEACPSDSQIGTVSIVTPLLTTPVTGEVFVGQQESSDPTSGNMYRLFLDATGQGVDVKLIGNVAANPSTGQLTATFPQNPQVPFSSLQLSLKGGPRAPLTNPETCGTATSNYSISSYANPTSPVNGSSSFPVSGNCALASQFTPSLAAGTASNTAGASSPFSFTLTRPDGQEWMSGIDNVSLPTGLNADIGSVPECSDTSAAAGTCPAASQVGVASITAGAGSEPFNLSNQPVFLTGPYEGAPFGLVEVVSGIAGPFDLGTTVVRQSISVNPTTAQVSLHSDALPTMLGGVPLDLQQLSIDINRPGFMRSPTSCAPKTISADVQGSYPGQPANVGPGYVGFAPNVSSNVQLTAPYQAGDCQALAFSPRLSLEASGRGQTRTDTHPTLTAKLTSPVGQANLSAVKVSLPLSLALDPKNSEHVCSVADAAKIACPSRTIVGKATAVTRILPHPLSGDVYLVQGERKGPHGTMVKTTPALLVPLDGADGVKINLHAQTTVNSSEQLVTTFQNIPDAGIQSFDLQINGGKKGILEVTGDQNLCRGNETAQVADNAQSGKAYYQSATLNRPACR